MSLGNSSLTRYSASAGRPETLPWGKHIFPHGDFCQLNNVPAMVHHSLLTSPNWHALDTSLTKPMLASPHWLYSHNQQVMGPLGQPNNSFAICQRTPVSSVSKHAVDKSNMILAQFHKVLPTDSPYRLPFEIENVKSQLTFQHGNQSRNPIAQALTQPLSSTGLQAGTSAVTKRAAAHSSRKHQVRTALTLTPIPFHPPDN
jgi:hypothetical protein